MVFTAALLNSMLGGPNACAEVWRLLATRRTLEEGHLHAIWSKDAGVKIFPWDFNGIAQHLSAAFSRLSDRLFNAFDLKGKSNL
jgi:hypothetical protein